MPHCISERCLLVNFFDCTIPWKTPPCSATCLCLSGADGGLLVLLDGRTYTVYYENMKDGFKVHINGHRCFFPDDFDPTCLTTPYPGGANISRPHTILVDLSF